MTLNWGYQEYKVIVIQDITKNWDCSSTEISIPDELIACIHKRAKVNIGIQVRGAMSHWWNIDGTQ